MMLIFKEQWFAKGNTNVELGLIDYRESEVNSRIVLHAIDYEGKHF